MLATKLVHLAVIFAGLCGAATSKTMTARATIPRPAACGKPETYCLTVDVSQGLPRNILHPERAITMPPAFNGKFRGTVPINCGKQGYQDLDMRSRRSNMSTISTLLQARSSDDQSMNPHAQGTSLGSSTPWVDFDVWCIT